MASQLFREESKLKGLSGVKTEQGKAGLNVREIKQPESHRDGDGDRKQPLLFVGHFSSYKRSWAMGHLQNKIGDENSTKPPTERILVALVALEKEPGGLMLPQA